MYDGQWWWGERQSHILHERPSAEAEGLECRLHLQWWGFVFKCWLQLFWIVKILIVYLISYLIWFSWCEWTRVIEWFVHRSVRICSRTGEIPPPVHTGALWETVRHEDSSLGHRTHHRTENRCEPELQQANNFITHHNPLHNIFIIYIFCLHSTIVWALIWMLIILCLNLVLGKIAELNQNCSNCTSSLHFSLSCQKAHLWQQANYLKSLHLPVKTFTKVRRLAN